MVSSDKGPTLHHVIPQLSNLRRKLNITHGTPPSEIVGLVAKALLDELESRFPDCGSKVDEFAWAHFLDPTAKGVLLKPRFLGGYDLWKQSIIDQLTVFVKSDVPSKTPTPEESEEEVDDDELAKALRDVYGSNPTQSGKRNVRVLEVESELEIFLKDAVAPQGSDLLEFWKLQCKRLPYLSRLARTVLAIPASSERVFSVAGQICTERRTLLAVDKVEMLVFLKENFPLMDRLGIVCPGF